MSPRKDTLFERFIVPIANIFLDAEAIKRQRDQIDWSQAIADFERPDLVYPPYYQGQPFHGIAQGYLTPDAAVTYDPITQYVLPPNETWVRQALVNAIQGQPGRILDLGCGTGSTTLLLQQTFPAAEVVGLDLSPYMLVIAAQKAAQANLGVSFCHGNAEQTSFPAAHFDVVTASLLFHETPPAVAQQVLQECFRLLKPGGQVLILDGNQPTLRQTAWLSDIFEEPYIRDYAAGSVDAWMGAAGFAQVRTESFWWLHQVTWGQKPLPITAPEPNEFPVELAPSY